MASEKAIYWLALGVVALGLNSTYQKTETGWAQRFAERSVWAAERAAQRGLSLVSMAEVMLGRNPGEVARLQGALARLEARESMRAELPELAQTQAEMEELNLEMDGLQTSMARIPCAQARAAAALRHQIAQIDVPTIADRTIYIQGPQINLQGLESLKSLDGLQSMESMKSFASLRALQDLKVSGMPGARVQIKIHRKDSPDGTI